MPRGRPRPRRSRRLPPLRPGTARTARPRRRGAVPAVPARRPRSRPPRSALALSVSPRSCFPFQRAHDWLEDPIGRYEAGDLAFRYPQRVDVFQDVPVLDVAGQVLAQEVLAVPGGEWVKPAPEG